MRKREIRIISEKYGCIVLFLDNIIKAKGKNTMFSMFHRGFAYRQNTFSCFFSFHFCTGTTMDHWIMRIPPRRTCCVYFLMWTGSSGQILYTY